MQYVVPWSRRLPTTTITLYKLDEEGAAGAEAEATDPKVLAIGQSQHEPLMSLPFNTFCSPQTLAGRAHLASPMDAEGKLRFGICFIIIKLNF